MRKIRSVVLACLVAASSVGCGGGGGDSSPSSIGGANPPPTTPPTTSLSSATVSWSAPQQNTDGSALTDLVGYEIRYGQNQDALDSYVSISGVGTQIYVIDNLTKGTWYFSVSARNSVGVLSVPSALASKVIT